MGLKVGTSSPSRATRITPALSPRTFSQRGPLRFCRRKGGMEGSLGVRAPGYANNMAKFHDCEEAHFVS